MAEPTINLPDTLADDVRRLDIALAGFAFPRSSGGLAGGTAE